MERFSHRLVVEVPWFTESSSNFWERLKFGLSIHVPCFFYFVISHLLFLRGSFGSDVVLQCINSGGSFAGVIFDLGVSIGDVNGAWAYCVLLLTL